MSMPTASQSQIFSTPGNNRRLDLNILLADDGSPSVSAAMDMVQDLQLGPGSSITVMGVIAPREASNYAVRQACLDQTRKRLNEKVVDVEIQLEAGTPAEKIIEWADHHNPDIILIGAQGRRATLEILLGGTAQQIVEYSHHPTLVVRQPYQGLRRLLLVTDGSAQSTHATEFVGRLPLPADCLALTVVHVMPPLLTYAEPTYPEGNVEAAIQFQHAQEESRGREIVDEAVDRLRELGLEAQSTLIRGDAATEIIYFAQKNHIDLIIAGARGVSKAPGWLVGSVSRKLVHYSGCSMLIVKDPTDWMRRN